MIIESKIKEIRARSREQKSRGIKTALVPTMGSLHEGHASLIRAARKSAGFVIVSIFVNPTQFGQDEDFERYPRDFERDKAVCLDSGADAIFFPDVAEMYPDGPSVSIEVAGRMTEIMCGGRRPGHFRGVATIVGKLFIAVEPDIAVFGQKDAQQAAVIKKMTKCLGFPVEIIVSPIVRESDGLAMSSRNSYLSPAERASAPLIKQSLDRAAELFEKGERSPQHLKQAVANSLGGSPAIRTDYVELVDNASFEPVDGPLDRPACLAVAAYIGKTRLIDNILLGE